LYNNLVLSSEDLEQKLHIFISEEVYFIMKRCCRPVMVAMPVIAAAQEVEVGRLQSEASPGKST
jgi:hypothetical protein